MWLWILLTSLTIANLILATPEQIDSDFLQDDVPNDDMYFYMNERSFDSPPRESRDIEARRRSALDKNFMRFGRSDSYLQRTYDDNNMDDIGDEEFLRKTRTHNKNDNFIRFGRTPGDFMRFGREPYSVRVSRGLKDKNFIRFGRSGPLKRSRRSVDTSEGVDEFKRANNRDMLRFGRANNRDMLRFGRANNRDMLRFGRRDNFLRFGRFPYTSNDLEGMKAGTNNSALDGNKEMLILPTYSTLLDLLTEIALQMRYGQKDSVPRPH